MYEGWKLTLQWWPVYYERRWGFERFEKNELVRINLGTMRLSIKWYRI